MITAILLSGIIQGGFLVFLLLRKPTSQIPNRILSTLILVLMFHLFLICLDVKNLFVSYPHFSRLSWLLPLSYGPLILLLTQSITDPEFRFHLRQLSMAFPFAVYAIILLPYFLQSGTEKAAFLSNAVLVDQADFGWMNTLTNFFHIGFTASALALFYRNLSKRSEHFSSSERIDIHWLKEFLTIVLSIMVCAVLIFYAHKYHVPYLGGIYPAHFLLVVALVYWIAFKLLNEHVVVVPEVAPSVALPSVLAAGPMPKYAKSGLSDEQCQDIAIRLTSLMDTEKPYRNNELTLADIAGRLDVPRHQLSQVINADFKVNFFEYVNQYRLAEFKTQVLDPANSHLSLLGIALECGFNSKATFNQAFKKLEGMTPSEFVRKFREGPPG